MFPQSRHQTPRPWSFLCVLTFYTTPPQFIWTWVTTDIWRCVTEAGFLLVVWFLQRTTSRRLWSDQSETVMTSDRPSGHSSRRPSCGRPPAPETFRFAPVNLLICKLCRSLSVFWGWTPALSSSFALLSYCMFCYNSVGYLILFLMCFLFDTIFCSTHFLFLFFNYCKNFHGSISAIQYVMGNLVGSSWMHLFSVWYT